MQAIFASLNALFAALTTIFTASQHYAKAIDNIGVWCDESTGSFADEARLDRSENLIDRRAEREQRRALRAAQSQVQLTNITSE